MEFIKIKLLKDTGKWKKGEVKTSDEIHAKNLISQGIAELYKEKKVKVKNDKIEHKDG